MQFDFQRPIQLSFRVLYIFGLLKFSDKYNSLYKLYRFLLHSVTSFPTLAFELISIILARNFEQFTEPLFIVFTMVAYSVKLVNILRLNKVVLNFVKQLKSKEFQLKNDEELKLLKKAQRIFHFVVVLYITTGYSVIVFGFSASAFGRDRHLPYPQWMPFDYQSSNKGYWYAFCYQFVGMSVSCLGSLCLDMFQCYLMHSVSLLYSLVGHRLAFIGNELNENMSSFELNQSFLHELRDIIRVHSVVKKLTKDCERLLSFPIFIQIILSAFVLCFTGYRLSFMSILDNPGRFLEMVDYLLVISLETYLPCHYGNQVTYEASKLTESLYNSNWTILPQKSRKLIFLYMEFLKEPVFLKAGSFFQIGLPVFVKTMNNAYSLFAVLIRMKN